MTMTDPQTTDVVDAAVTAALQRIDSHLAALPTERTIVTLDEHTDILLDVRQAVRSITAQAAAQVAPAAAPEPEPAPLADAAPNPPAPQIDAPEPDAEPEPAPSTDTAGAAPAPADPPAADAEQAAPARKKRRNLRGDRRYDFDSDYHDPKGRVSPDDEPELGPAEIDEPETEARAEDFSPLHVAGPSAPSEPTDEHVAAPGTAAVATEPVDVRPVAEPVDVQPVAEPVEAVEAPAPPRAVPKLAPKTPGAAPKPVPTPASVPTSDEWDEPVTPPAAQPEPSPDPAAQVAPPSPAADHDDGDTERFDDFSPVFGEPEPEPAMASLTATIVGDGEDHDLDSEPVPARKHDCATDHPPVPVVPVDEMIHCTSDIQEKGAKRIGTAKCGFTETVKARTRFTRMTAWFSDLTCPECIERAANSSSFLGAD
jgi:hypothetical protein